MQKDYKMFPPTVDWDNIDWSTRKPQMDFPVQVYLIFFFFFERTSFFSVIVDISYSFDLQFLYGLYLCKFLV